MTPQISYSEVRKAIFLLPVWQLVAGLILALIFGLFSGSYYALSAFFGASIGFAGTLVFAFIMFGFGEQSSQNLLRKMFRAEAIKILTVGLMFYLATAKLALPFLPVIVGFMVTLIVFIVALLIKFK